MSNRVDKMLPLAKVKKGVTLSTSSAGDQHFLVNSNGSSEKIPLEVACKLYIAAEKKGDLLWTGSPASKGSKKAAAAAAPPSGNAQWREELREKLGYEPDPK